jgi:WD40 repeat protein/serine/threonine protein kinase
MENIKEKTIRGYQLHELLAQGGMGEVYRATQTIVGREVVIKKILPKYASQPEFIRRFEAEAKLVAQLDHLHIAPLYDYWRDPTGAYLVMRYLRGGALRDSIRESGPWSPRASVRLLNQIGSALTVAHRRNVVHRDIKPANILLDNDHNAYLTDFGIALEMQDEDSASSSSQAVTGSAGYISPEQINLQAVTPRADIYSMSLVMYEALTGHHPYPDAKSPIALFLKHVNEPLPTMDNYPPGVHDVLQKAAAKDPEDRFENMLEFASAFKNAIVDADMPVSVGSEIEIEDFDTTTFDMTTSDAVEDVENPYKGLAAFQENDADDFFGRDKLIQTLLDRMEEDHPFQRFLAVVGPSGSGKSSVVKAGLLPSLRKGSLPGSESWFIVQMIPGVSPISELEEALMRVSINPVPDLKEALGDHGELVQIVNDSLPDDGSELVLVIDQFEEVFTTGSAKEREDFLQSLYQTIIHEDGRLRLVITLRADFYDRPLGIQNFSGLMQQRTEVVIPFTAEELEKSITGPARRVKVFFQQGLAAQIVSEVNEQPGVLPMLQYALTELFNRREGPIIMSKEYQEIGGVLGALAKQAEELYQSMDDDAKEAARQLFLRLVTLGEGTEDTRRRALLSEIMSAYPNEDVMNGVIEQFASKRLLTADRDPGTRSPTVEVAHEALIREWGTLKVWLDESRDDVRLQRMLYLAAQEWHEANNDDSFLLRGGRLVTFEDWIDTSTIAVAELERTYYDTSIKERDRLEAEEAERAEREIKLQETSQRRLKQIMVGSFVFGIIGVGLAVLVFFQSQEAAASAAEAQTQAAIAATSESNANNNAVTATIAQGEAIAQANNAETQVALASTAEAKAVDEANNAQIQADNAATAEIKAVELANVAATSENDALNAQGEAVVEANNAATSAAEAIEAQEDAVLQADIAKTSAADAAAAQSTAVKLADLAATSESQAVSAQADALIAAERAQSLALSSFASQFSQSDSPLAIALALEANRVNDPPLQAQRVLISVAYEGPRKFVPNDFGGIRDVATIVFPDELSLTEQAEQNIYIDETYNFQIFTAHDTGVISEWNPEDGLSMQTMISHNSAVNSIDVWANESLSTRWLASGDQSGRVILWDLNSGEIIHEFGEHTGVINTVDFRSDGQRIVTASDDGFAIVWDTRTGDEVNRFNTVTNSSINGASFSPNGQNLLILADDAMRLISANSTTNQFLEFGRNDAGLVVEPTNRIRSAVFSPNGDFIVTTGSAGSTSPEIWDVARRTLTDILPEHNGPVNSVSVSDDNNFILSTSDDFSIILSAAESAEEIRSYNAHQNRVTQAIFTDNDARVVTVSSDGDMYLWDKLPISRSLQSLQESGAGIDTMAQAPYDSDFFLSTSATGELSLWNGISGTLVESYRQTGSDAPQTVLAVNPLSVEDDIVVALGSENIEIRVFNTNTTLADIVVDPQVEYSFVDPIYVESQWVNSLAYSPDGTLLVSGGGFFVRSERREDDINFKGEDTVYPILHLWDANTGELIRQYDTTDFVIEEGLSAPITSVRFSPDGQDILSGLEDGRLIVWSAQTGEQVREFTGHSAKITAIEFSLDEQQLLTASNDRAIILWEYRNATIVRRFTEHRGAVNDIAFSPNGRQILSGSDDTRVILWDINTGNSIQRFSEQERAITGVAFIKEGRVAASGSVDGSLVKREFDTGGELIEWIETNRFVPILTCQERTRFNLSCSEDSVADDSTSATG